MHVLFRFGAEAKRAVAACLLALGFFCATAGVISAAGTTGTISGTIVDQKTGAPLANVTVAAVSPTGSFHGKTDSHGFFSFTGVAPDTFTVSFELPGFQPSSVTGIAVFADQVQTVNAKLEKSLNTIATITSRSAGGAFQPKQAQDTYTVTSDQIQTIQGRSDSISESNLLVSLPGATYDSSGYPVLRGGRENEEGFQFEGIDYTDAFTAQFVNSLALNPSIGSLQLTPGAGDASTGNAGTGTINLISKRGTYPGEGSIQGTIQGPDYDHELGLEYGFATRSGNFSNYFSFEGTREFGNNWGHGIPARQLGTTSFGADYFDTGDQISSDIVDNMVFKFGHNQNQSFQIVFQNEIYTFAGSYGSTKGFTFKDADPYWLAQAQTYFPSTPLSYSQIENLVGLFPYQTSATSSLTRPFGAYYQPNSTLKLQYSNNLDSSTFVTAKFYRVAAVTTFDDPFAGQGVIFGSYYLPQGGNRTGGALDITKQLGSKHLLQLGGKYDFLAPTYDQVDPGDGFLSAAYGGEAYDFVPNTPAACPIYDGTKTPACGYLYNYLANPGPIPMNDEQSSTLRQDIAAYLTDTYTPNANLKVQGGVRVDGSRYRFGSSLSEYYEPTTIDANGFPLNAAGQEVTSDSQPYPYTLTSQESNPLITEPRLSAAWDLGASDAVRASYGRSVEFPALGVVDWQQGKGQFARFAGIPANQAVCGVTQNLTCQNYADQLYWVNQNFIEGVPYQPALPATFNNYDFSYSHEFKGGIGLKVTPFYRRGYNATASVASPLLGHNGQPVLFPDGTVVTGPPTATNLGVEHTSGVEFYLTKEAPIGFSGSLSATYLNESSNVIPNSFNEDFFPSIPPQSLALGNQYRVGFISPFQATLAAQYKSKGGIRINPQIYYTRGYPIGEGTLTAVYINGVPYNVPNTNVTDPNGSSSAQQYVDPQDPGTLKNPKIDATRGTANGASAGGVLGRGAVFANMTIEWSPPGSRSTIGLQVLNLANNIYAGFGGGNPIVGNTRYQPVTTGVSGPLSGYSALAAQYPTLGDAYYYGPNQNGQGAYLVQPQFDVTQYQLYYNFKL
jgi:hypothetical protein